MARINLKYAYPVKDRYGKIRWYFRISGKNVRLHGEPGSASFMADYHDAIGKIEPLSPYPHTRAGSVAAAIALYLHSADFLSLAQATRTDRRRVLESARNSRNFVTEESLASWHEGIRDSIILGRHTSLARPFFPVLPGRSLGATTISSDGTQPAPAGFTGGGAVDILWGLNIDGNDDVWVANLSPRTRAVVLLAGVDTKGHPAGTKTGDVIHMFQSGSIQMLTDVSIDPAGNVWAANNCSPKRRSAIHRPMPPRLGAEGRASPSSMEWRHR